jgi:hydroxyacylglutathione hydrolase
MKRINKVGPRVLGGFPRPPQLTSELPGLIDERALVVDTRAAPAYARAHVPGTLNVPVNRSFNTWAGWLLPYENDFYLIVERTERVDEAVRDLAMIGLDRVKGFFTADVIDAWRGAGRETGTVRQITADELADQIASGRMDVVDVRGATEWEAGHLPGVPNVPVGYLAERIGELPAERPVVVHCQGGARSAIAASLLLANGVQEVVNLTGGYQEWVAGGHPVEREEAAAGAR